MRRLQALVLLPTLACADRSIPPEEYFEEGPTVRGGEWIQFIVDFDGDGLDDLAAAVGEGGREFAIVFGRAASAGELEPDVTLTLPPQGPTDVEGGIVSVGDVNGDARRDVVAVFPDVATPVLVLGREVRDPIDLGRAGEGVVPIMGLEGALSVKAAGDVDADGFDDIIFSGARGGRSLVVARGRRDWERIDLNVPGGPNRFAITGTSAAADGVGDVNGDGFDDIALPLQGGAVSLLSGAAVAWGVQVDQVPQPPLAMIEAPLDQSNWVTVPGPGVPPVGVYPLGDLNADGFSDFAAGHLVHAERQTTLVVYGGLLGPLVERRQIALGDGGFQLDGEAIALHPAGDVDGDGDVDLALGGIGADVFHSIDLRWSSNATSIVLTRPDLTRTSVASGGRLPRPTGALHYGRAVTSGDFDGDGTVDLAVGFLRLVEGDLAAERAHLLLHAQEH